MMAGIIGNNSTAALMFKDVAAAHEILFLCPQTQILGVQAYV